MKKRIIPQKNTPLILGLCAVSLFFFALAEILPGRLPSRLLTEMFEGAKTMERAVEAVRECRLDSGVSIDLEKDINGTGLIGLDYSAITTSIGSLPAKRTSTNPNFAGMLVFLMHKAGLREGDCVAVGASSSFPSLVIAALAACRASGISPLLVCSLGASQWGANHPDFHWLNMWKCLREKEIFSVDPVAWSLGGDRDMGMDMSPEGRALLQTALEKLGSRVISNPNLRQNVSERMSLLKEAAGERGIRAFINIGGSWANLGTDESILDVRPGLSKPGTIQLPAERGMIQEMAARGIPVIHCLFIRGLASEFNLPWDPSPLPKAGEGGLFRMAREQLPLYKYIILAYLLCMGILAFFGRRPRL